MEFDSITSLINYCSNKYDEKINILHPIRIEVLTLVDSSSLNIILLDCYALNDDKIEINNIGTAFMNHILPKLQKFEKIVNDNKLRFKLNSKEMKNINELFELYINKQEYLDVYSVIQNSNSNSNLKIEDVLESDDIPNEELYCYPPKEINILDYYFNSSINIFISNEISHYISKIYLYNCRKYDLRKELCFLYNNNTGDSIYMPSYFSKAKFKESKLYNTKMGTIARNEFFKSMKAPHDLGFKEFLISGVRQEKIEKNEELRKIKEELDKYHSEKSKLENSDELNSDELDELDDFEADNEFKMYKCYLKRYITGDKAILKNGCKIEIDNSKFNYQSIFYQYPQLIDYDFNNSQILKYYLESLINITSWLDDDLNEKNKELLKNNDFDKMNDLLLKIEEKFNEIIDSGEDFDELNDYNDQFKNIRYNLKMLI